MVTLSHPKSPHSSLHIFPSTNKPSPSMTSPTTSSTACSSSLTTMKMKAVIHNLIFSHICRVIRALSKAKSILLEVFRDNQLLYLKQTKRKHKYSKKIIFGSFRLHYNWCSSSHVLPIPSPHVLDGLSSPTSHIYFDTTWNSVYSSDDGQSHNVGHDQACNSGIISKEDEGELASYLQWLEEKGPKHEKSNDQREGKAENEIDKLADMFIASCHEKFRLEKIESYRRYQELLARSM